MSLRKDLETLDVPNLIVMTEEGHQITTGHLVEKTINEILSLVLNNLPKNTPGLPKEQPITGDEFTPGIYHGWGRNAGLAEVRSILEETSKGENNE